MEILAKQASIKAPEDICTGDGWLDLIAKGEPPSRLRINSAHFAPGARTVWHNHSLAQTFYVTEGLGLAQARGGKIINLVPGDVVYTPPDVWHWHGAAPDHFM